MGKLTGFMEFERQVVTNENEPSEDVVIAHSPRRDAEEDYQQSETCAPNAPAEGRQLIDEPGQEKWQQDHNCGIGQYD